MLIRGRIVEERKNYCSVDTEIGIVRSLVKGVVRKQKSRCIVGDVVTIEVFNADTREGIIRELDPRKNKLDKPAIANVDQVLLVVTYKEPILELEFVDRFLFLTGTFVLPTTIIFNKKDLLDSCDLAPLRAITDYYKSIGYACVQASAVTGEGIDDIKHLCENSLSIVAGPSGTGKSTLLASIFPDHVFRVGALSKQIGRGVHTTSHTTLLKLGGRGYIADSPGFSYLSLPIVPEKDVSMFFPEFAVDHGGCRFADCMHENEPGCTVKDRVENGTVLRSRYMHYLKIYRYMEQQRKQYRDTKKKAGKRTAEY